MSSCLLKNNLPDEKVVIQLDFAENYQFTIQDEIQSYHWTKTYCTVHPVVIHVRDGGTVKVDSMCFLSNDLSHDTSFVWALQREVCKYIRAKYPHIKIIEYYSDGCGGQYKNYKNFINLSYHLEDFGFIAIWIFFASCHGKSNCDGIKAATKRKLRNQSLTVGPHDAILSSQSAYSFLVSAMPSVRFFHIDCESIKDDKEKLKERYKRAKTVDGTRSFHHFCSSAVGSVTYRRTAFDEQPAGTRNFFVPARLYSAEELSAGCYVACSYDNHWWIGIIECVESADAQVNFLHPHGPSTSFHWPARQDSCWVPFPNKILKLMTSTGRQFCFPAEELKGVQAIFVREW